MNTWLSRSHLKNLNLDRKLLSTAILSLFAFFFAAQFLIISKYYVYCVPFWRVHQLEVEWNFVTKKNCPWNHEKKNFQLPICTQRSAIFDLCHSNEILNETNFTVILIHHYFFLQVWALSYEIIFFSSSLSSLYNS